jgi:phosphocarrier protein
MVEKILLVENQSGIHARPSAAIVNCLSSYSSNVRLETLEGKADARSIMEILMLRILCGAEVKVIAEGSDEGQAVDALENLFKDHFGVKE